MFGLPLKVREAKPDQKVELQGQLARFPRRLRKRVRKAALEHNYLADLAFTFPMALFAIAAKSRGAEATRRARALVFDGAPLRALAHELELALWLRRLPPEALVEHVPRLPNDARFTRRIVNLMPDETEHVGRWLRVTDIAVHAHSEEFALWIGNALRGAAMPPSPQGVALLAAFAWHSARPASEAGSWVKTPWRPKIGLAAAVRDADNWLDRLQFACQVPAPLVAALPPRDNTVGAYCFHHLAWGRDLIREGEAMENCLETYASDLRSGNQVWSIRCGPQSVADLEIEFLDGQRGMPRLVQLYGKENEPAPDAVWRASYRWLARWKLSAAPVVVKEQPARIDPARWARLWQPYWQAKGIGRVFPEDAAKLDEQWLANQSPYLWELNRLQRSGS